MRPLGAWSFNARFGELGGQLAKGEPDTYAGLWITNGQDYGVTVNMTGNLDKISEYAKGTAFADIIEVRQVPKSLKQLEREQEQAVTSLRKRGIPLESGINVYKNQVELYVLDTERVSSLLGTLGLSSVFPADSGLIKVPTFSSQMVNAFAGNTMTNTTEGNCTSGYSVYDSFGLYGITTAGHCKGARSYASLPLTKVGDWFSGPRDVEWHKASTPGNPLFKPWARDRLSGTPVYREIYDVGNRGDQPIGALVCKYGYRTGHTCGEIVEKNFNPATSSVWEPSPNNSSTFIRLNKVGPYNLIRGGDSGGPVYVGHQAYGLSVGGWNPIEVPGCLPNYCGDMIYMAINYVTDVGLRIHFAPR